MKCAKSRGKFSEKKCKTWPFCIVMISVDPFCVCSPFGSDCTSTKSKIMTYI